MEKPSLDEVLKYAKPMVGKWISQKAKDATREQKEEIEQEAYLRLIKKYPKIEAEGWKALVYQHCRGAVLDYMKHGAGFEETSWSLQKPEEVGDVHAGKMHNRISLSNSDGEDLSVEQVAGVFGAFSPLDMSATEINWDLVARMSSQDECLHAAAKFLRGITLAQMAPVFGVKIARAGQLVQAFFERFDDPEHADCPWFKQCCYALGVCEALGMPHIDQSKVLGMAMGSQLPEVDLDSLQPASYLVEMDSQMSFDVES